MTLGTAATGQSSNASFDITPGPSPSVAVNITGERRRNLGFSRSVAGVDDLEIRITNLRLADLISGSSISFRELQPGEYLSEREFLRASYDVSLSPHRRRDAAAHVSWINGDTGILMLADLLPQSSGPLAITFTGESPPVSSIDLERGERTANLHEPKNSIFYVGTGWRAHATHRCRPCPIVYLSGSWHFTDDEAVTFVGDIAERYNKLFPSQVLPSVQIAIAKFPVPTEPGAWEAETRGRSVTIISSDMPFRSQSLQRLHEQLRHEMFHLWIPGKLNLTGNYDWFYEGFALYQSLRLAVSLNRIRFDDFLDTLSRAHTIDSAYTQRQSLIEASRSRFEGSNTQVYARGLVVAFLTDLALLGNSKGERSVEDLLRDLYLKHRKPAAPVDGNRAVIDLMNSAKGVNTIVSKYVKGAETIDWAKPIADAGIEDVDPGLISTLRVKKELNDRQRTLLDKLGYNNWRKLSPRTR